jgi:predicted DNA-binding transcriptional regulator AlpA
MKNLQKMIVRPSELQAIYGISKSTAYRMMRKGTFPKLVALSPRCKGWNKEELDRYFARAALTTVSLAA